MELLKYLDENGLTEFQQIKKHFTKQPFNMQVRDTEDLYLLIYDQRKSDFSHPVVRNCRGIILEKKTNRIVSYPFNKFFNFNEELADKINPETARYYEKIDGCLIKAYFYKDRWYLATQKVIDITVTKDFRKKFYEPILECLKRCGIDGFEAFTALLDKRYTYIFEFCDPAFDQIVKYSGTRFYHIGTRDASQEPYPELADVVVPGIERPCESKFSTIEECLQKSRTLNPDETEGYVVCDADWNRAKIKGNLYLKKNYAKCRHKNDDNAAFTEEELVDIVKKGEADEVVAYFPGLKERFDQLKLN